MTSTLSNFPTVQFDEVIHIGTMKKEDKQRNSLEGAGLSVSLHPDEWQAIAKLGGQKRYRLQKEKGVFLNFHELSEANLEELARWGMQKGYIEKSKVYSYVWIDGETEEDVTVESTDYNEILAEADFEESNIQEKEGYAATEKLNVESNHKDIPPFLAMDFLAPLFAESALGIDGVWWEDELDPWSLSAPRGVINLLRLSEWTKTEIEYA